MTGSQTVPASLYLQFHWSSVWSLAVRPEPDSFSLQHSVCLLLAWSQHLEPLATDLNLAASTWHWQPLDGSHSVAALSSKLSWPLSKVVTSNLLGTIWARVTYQPLWSAVSTTLIYWCDSLLRPLGIPVITVHLHVWASPPTWWVRAWEDAGLATSFFTEISLFTLSVGSNSQFRSFLSPRDSLPPFFSSSCCYIPAWTSNLREALPLLLTTPPSSRKSYQL